MNCLKNFRKYSLSNAESYVVGCCFMRGFVKYVFKATLNTSHKDKGKEKL